MSLAHEISSTLLTDMSLSLIQRQCSKGKERLVAMLDCTEDLQLRFLPLPDALNPVFHPRFLVRVDMEREIGEGELWRISQQEDNLPTDLGRSGLPLLVLGHISDAAKVRILLHLRTYMPAGLMHRRFVVCQQYFAGVATLIVGGTFSRFNLV